MDRRKRVACTEPRRLAAITAAQRVASERNVNLGGEVGYRVRFDSQARRDTRLCYMTDGILLQEAKSDRDFSAYACVIIDEAHERTISTDLLMVLLKAALARRDDFKVIIMSATLSTRTFADYFANSSMFHIQGRMYPVDIQYLKRATASYLKTTAQIVRAIHEGPTSGDILVFLPSVSDVEKACASLRELEDLDVMPLYSALPSSEQQRILSTSLVRKCVVATNIAETSLTVEGIVFVVDTGLAKMPGYNPRTNCETLFTEVISKASAQQRAGRAGRTRTGVCYQLYDQQTFDNMMEATLPGVIQSDVTSELLMLKKMGFRNLTRFDWVTPPLSEVYLRGYGNPLHMGYIAADGTITEAGALAASLPVHPVWYNAFLEGAKLGCGPDILTIAAICSTQNSLLLRPRSSRYTADFTRRHFICPLSDHITMMNIIYGYMAARSQGFNMEAWCKYFFVSHAVVEEVLRIRKQLEVWAERLFEPFESSSFGPENHDGIRKALARSLFWKSAFHQPGRSKDVYVTMNYNCPVLLHPDSSLCGLDHTWVVYDKMSYGRRQYLRTVTAVDLDWLLDLEYFDIKNLPLKRAGERYRQEFVKDAIENAREWKHQA